MQYNAQVRAGRRMVPVAWELLSYFTLDPTPVIARHCAAQKTARRREPLEPRSASSWRGCHIERKAPALLPINGGIFSGIDTAGVRGPDGGVGQSCRWSGCIESLPRERG